MESKVAKAHLKQLRMTPRKVKVVLDLIRNKNVAEAAAILKTTNKIACGQRGNEPRYGCG